MNRSPTDKNCSLLGTPLEITTYEHFTSRCKALSAEPRTVSVDFSNTQIVTMRRNDPAFRAITNECDYFIPDGMPLIWCLNFRGAKMRDRVYGPTFMRECILSSPAPYKHYFLGGSQDCVSRLAESFVNKNPAIQIVGVQNGYYSGLEEERRIVDEINRLSPDFIWVGLGTPKQQEWIHRNKKKIKRGIIFAVGFAFDVNAGTKKDAPLWMQKLGMTWVFRLCSEPLRLGPRYVRYNSFFLFYLLWDSIGGHVFSRIPDK